MAATCDEVPGEWAADEEVELAVAEAMPVSPEDEELDQFLSVPPPGATEVIFVREGVCVQPSRRGSAQACIPGRYTLVKQWGVVFMAWLPYSQGVLHDDGSFKVTQTDKVTSAADGSKMNASYAMHPLPLTEVRALRAAPAPRRWWSLLPGGWGRRAVRAPQHGQGSQSACQPGPVGSARGPGQCLAITLKNGLTLAPLLFPPGGVEALLNVLREQTHLVRAATDVHVWLVNETVDPLARSLTALELGDVLLGGPPTGGAQATWRPPAPFIQSTTTAQSVQMTPWWPTWGVPGDGPWEFNTQGEEGEEDIPEAACQISTSVDPLLVLEGLRRGALSVLSGLAGLVHDHVLMSAEAGLYPEEGTRLDGEHGDNASAVGPGRGAHSRVQGEETAPAGPCKSVRESGVSCNTPAHVGVPSSTTLVAPLPVGTSGKRRSPKGRGLQSKPSHATPSPQASPPGLKALPLVDSVASSCSASPFMMSWLADGASQLRVPGGCQQAAPVPSVVGVLTAGSTSSSDSEDYELVERVQSGSAEGGQGHQSSPPPPPLSLEEWAVMHDAAGCLTATGAALLRERAWSSGLQPEVRRLAWPYLLGLAEPGQTPQQRAAATADRRVQYAQICKQWQALLRVPTQENRHWHECCMRVDKDARRTDRHMHFFSAEGGPAIRALRRILLSFAVHVPHLGYSQGMSDLASPLLAVLCDEAEAFWAFHRLMLAWGSVFNLDLHHGGMHAQLAALRSLVQLLDPQLYAHLVACDCLEFFFAFRWLLCIFKREFSFDETLRLWEGLWAAPQTPHMQLYLAAAVLMHHRRAILADVHDLDSMLKMCLSLSGQLSLEPMLGLSSVLERFAGEAGQDVILHMQATLAAQESHLL